MPARIPVYSDENNLHHVSIFMEDEDGTFRRTQSEPLRMLRDNIDGVSTPQGSVISHKFEKNDYQWNSPTVTFHYGRPQSFYQFIREKLAENRLYVFTKPNLSGRIIQFTLHELRLKPSTSQRILKLLKEKYTEAIEIWSAEQYLHHVNRKKAAGAGVNAKRQRLLEKKKRAIQKLKQNHQSAIDEQQRNQIYVRYTSQDLSTEPMGRNFENEATSPGMAKSASSKKLKRISDKERKLSGRLRFLLD